MSKRLNGEGSVYQRTDGKWVAAFTDPSTGKRVVKYGKSQAEARGLLRSMTSRADSGVVAVDKSSTLKAFSKWWLESRAGRNRATSTVEEYRSRFSKHILPALGSKKIGQVTALDVEALMDSMARKGLSASTIKAVRNAGAACYSDAVRARLVAANPFRDVVMPEGAKGARKVTPPSTAQVRELLKTTAGTQLGMLCSLMAFSGCRPGEALAATWDDLDLKAGTWTISRHLTRGTRGQVQVAGGTKAGGSRTLQLPEAVVTELKAHKIRQAKSRLKASYWVEGEPAWVFPTSIGTKPDPRNVRKELVGVLPEGWPGSLHGLRHWHASVSLLSSGLPMAAVSKALGHASTRTTDQTYSHLLEEASATIAATVAAALK